MKSLLAAARRGLADPRFWGDASAFTALASATFAVMSWLGCAVAFGLVSLGAFIVRIVVAARRRRLAAQMRAGLRERFGANEVLYNAGGTLQLSERHAVWRITLYSLDSKTLEWAPRARASADPELQAHRGDDPLLKNQGILRGPVGRCDMTTGVPDISPLLDAPEQGKREWVLAQSAWGIPRSRASRIRMGSRSYWGQAYRIRRRNGVYSTLGLVVESTSDRPFTPGAFDATFGRPFFEALDSLLVAEEALSELP